MSLLSCASGTSIWRGYDYYKEQKVTAYDCLTDSQYMGIVRGSEGALYTTTIDLLHPRRSKCNCPHADGRRIICKHMIALFFTIYPDEAEQFYNDAIKAEEDAEEYENEVYEKVVKRRPPISHFSVNEYLNLRAIRLARAIRSSCTGLNSVPSSSLGKEPPIKCFSSNHS